MMDNPILHYQFKKQYKSSEPLKSYSGFIKSLFMNNSNGYQYRIKNSIRKLFTNIASSNGATFSHVEAESQVFSNKYLQRKGRLYENSSTNKLIDRTKLVRNTSSLLFYKSSQRSHTSGSHSLLNVGPRQSSIIKNTLLKAPNKGAVTKVPYNDASKYRVGQECSVSSFSDIDNSLEEVTPEMSHSDSFQDATVKEMPNNARKILSETISNNQPCSHRKFDSIDNRVCHVSVNLIDNSNKKYTESTSCFKSVQHKYKDDHVGIDKLALSHENVSADINRINENFTLVTNLKQHVTPTTKQRKWNDISIEYEIDSSETDKTISAESYEVCKHKCTCLHDASISYHYCMDFNLKSLFTVNTLWATIPHVLSLQLPEKQEPISTFQQRFENNFTVFSNFNIFKSIKYVSRASETIHYLSKLVIYNCYCAVANIDQVLHLDAITVTQQCALDSYYNITSLADKFSLRPILYENSIYIAAVNKILYKRPPYICWNYPLDSWDKLSNTEDDYLSSRTILSTKEKYFGPDSDSFNTFEDLRDSELENDNFFDKHNLSLDIDLCYHGYSHCQPVFYNSIELLINALPDSELLIKGVHLFQHAFSVIRVTEWMYVMVTKGSYCTHNTDSFNTFDELSNLFIDITLCSHGYSHCQPVFYDSTELWINALPDRALLIEGSHSFQYAFSMTWVMECIYRIVRITTLLLLSTIQHLHTSISKQQISYMLSTFQKKQIKMYRHNAMSKNLIFLCLSKAIFTQDYQPINQIKITIIDPETFELPWKHRINITPEQKIKCDSITCENLNNLTKFYQYQLKYTKFSLNCSTSELELHSAELYISKNQHTYLITIDNSIDSNPDTDTSPINKEVTIYDNSNSNEELKTRFFSIEESVNSSDKISNRLLMNYSEQSDSHSSSNSTHLSLINNMTAHYNEILLEECSENLCFMENNEKYSPVSFSLTKNDNFVLETIQNVSESMLTKIKVFHIPESINSKNSESISVTPNFNYNIKSDETNHDEIT